MMTRILLLGILAITVLFGACGEQQQKKQTETQSVSNEPYLHKGKEIAGNTFTVLSGTLQQAMLDGGVPNAVALCNLAAYPLVDSLANIHNASIKRTSLKIRNPNNEPNEIETKVLEEYAKASLNNEAMEPKTISLADGSVGFFAPIKLAQQCLHCHGKVGNTLEEENYALIKELYPEDQATGYTDGDLRGIWSIKFRPEISH